MRCSNGSGQAFLRRMTLTAVGRAAPIYVFGRYEESHEVLFMLVFII